MGRDRMAGELLRTFEMTADDRVSDVVVPAIAESKALDPMDLEPLARSVDPDALDDLFRHPRAAPGTVRFCHGGVLVEVEADGSGAIYELEDDAASGRGSNPSDSSADVD